MDIVFKVMAGTTGDVAIQMSCCAAIVVLGMQFFFFFLLFILFFFKGLVFSRNYDKGYVCVNMGLACAYTNIYCCVPKTEKNGISWVKRYHEKIKKKIQKNKTKMKRKNRNLDVFFFAHFRKSENKKKHKKKAKKQKSNKINKQTNK